MNEFKVIIYKKNGSKSFTGNKIELKESLIDIQINKKLFLIAKRFEFS